MALAEIFALWCSGNTEQVDRLFRRTGLIRDKWDRIQSGSTYGMITLIKAMKKCTAFYSPMMATADEDFNDILARLTEFNLLENRRYTDITELTAEIIRSFVERIDVYKPENVPGTKTKKQTICIHWTFMVQLIFRQSMKKTA